LLPILLAYWHKIVEKRLNVFNLDKVIIFFCIRIVISHVHMEQNERKGHNVIQTTE